MRGRGLLKETSSPNLCAFCAHRLGQTRTPSHVQRRFLQSTQAVAKPPAEAIATKGGDSQSSQPQQERSNVKPSSGLGNWGRGAGTGSTKKSVGGWGLSTPPPSHQGMNGGATFDRRAELLPHEQRARELLMLQDKQQNERPMNNRHFGAGPQSNRAGRYEHTGWYERDERIRMSRESLAREKARELQLRSREQQEEVARSAGPIIRKTGGGARHVISNSEQAPPSGVRIRYRQDSTEDSRRVVRQPVAPPMHRRFNPGFDRDDGDDLSPRETHIGSGAAPSAWNNLRRNGERDTTSTPFTEARSEREERAKMATYSPLLKSDISTDQRYPRQLSDNDQRHQHHPDTQARDSYSYERSYPGQRFRYNEPSVSTLNQQRMRERVEEPVFQPTIETQTIDISQYRGNESSARPEKQKKVRSQYEPETAGRGKGRDRDKARRKQHFATSEEADEEAEAALARAEVKRLRKLEKAAKRAAAPTPILLPEFISVSNLAVALKVKYEDFVEKLQDLGYEETSRDHILNAENAGLIAGEYNFEPIIDRSESEDLKARDPAEDPSILPSRPPVVTIMGHVDHGKTTLLDYLRKSSVTASEHGGITQHIGAFSVPMPGGKTITFLDTPGHAAFLSMRQRGANVTDIVILVVAADDSVKPQTIEAINHAKAAKVPMIVAINKIDKGDSDIQRVKQDLGRYGVELEDFGGDTQVVLVSGKTGQGMDELEDAAVTLSEILDMRAETDGPAEGWVLEASIKSMGKVATVLVRRGTMRVGDFIVAGKTWARIRCLRNEAGVEIEEAGPGTPVEIDGWREQPLAGDEVLEAPDEAKAKSVVEYRLENEERDKMAEDMEAVNEFRRADQERKEREKAEALAKKEAAEAGELLQQGVQDAASGPKQVYFIIKGDVSGSVEAVVDQLSVLGNKEVALNIIRSGVGQLSEFDVEHAAAAKGYLINFNTTVDSNIAHLAERAKVPIIDHNIIYRLVDDVKAELSKHLPPLISQRVLGEAEIAQIFEITLKGRKKRNIAGCKVRNGTVTKTDRVRVLRDGEKVFDGVMDSLKFVKKEVSEIKKGGECGMGFLDWGDFQPGDLVQSYEQIEEKRYL